MNHPFNLSLSELETLDLDFQEELSDEEDKPVSGGYIRCGTPPSKNVTTYALGEEGGWCKTPVPPIKPPKCPPDATTLAIGEEGGVLTTMALGEEGGNF